ncbi:hypothetical protein [Streptomyces rubellomurinus]|uniref:hypothetical protein n=1 Tax=Streptomyces rubellomurinus (strain ATCC 31215) TaxID=359131 RepID=UPI000D147CA7|nr:hypothetical protein [Streptomyces rubellomurinus]
MSTDWSSGPVEGRVNDLKALKRSMFGRAKPPLLRKRLLLTRPAADHKPSRLADRLHRIHAQPQFSRRRQAETSRGGTGPCGMLGSCA